MLFKSWQPQPEGQAQHLPPPGLHRHNPWAHYLHHLCLYQAIPPGYFNLIGNTNMLTFPTHLDGTKLPEGLREALLGEIPGDTA